MNPLRFRGSSVHTIYNCQRDIFFPFRAEKNCGNEKDSRARGKRISFTPPYIQGAESSLNKGWVWGPYAPKMSKPGTIHTIHYTLNILSLYDMNKVHMTSISASVASSSRKLTPHQLPTSSILDTKLRMDFLSVEN